MAETINANVSAILARGVKVYAQETAPSDLKGLWIDTTDNTGNTITNNKIWLSTSEPTVYSEDADYTGYAYNDLTGPETASALTVKVGDVVYCGDGYIGIVASLVAGDINVLMLKNSRISFIAGA